MENTVWAIKPVSYGGFDIPVDRVYFIDYGTARIMPSGPGSGARIYDYDEDGGKYTPTEATDAMDPYAYDILALGYTFENGFLVYQIPAPHSTSLTVVHSGIATSTHQERLPISPAPGLILLRH